MRSGPVSTQTAPGLNCRSQLLLSLPHCFKLVLFCFFFSTFNNPSNQTGWLEIALPLSSFLAVSPSQVSRPDAGKRGGGGLLAVKSTPILGKPWVTAAVVLLVWRIGGGVGLSTVNWVQNSHDNVQTNRNLWQNGRYCGFACMLFV